MIKSPQNTVRAVFLTLSCVTLCSCGGLSKSDQETIDVPPLAAVTGTEATAVSTPAGATTAATAKPVVVTPKPVAKMPYSKADGVKYVVESGDSLSVIAAKHGASMGDVMKVNGISNANKIRIGETLVLPVKKSEVADAASVVTDASETVSAPAPVTESTATAADTSGLSLPSISTGAGE